MCTSTAGKPETDPCAGDEFVSTNVVVARAHNEAIQRAMECVLDRGCAPKKCGTARMLAFGATETAQDGCPATKNSVTAVLRSVVTRFNGTSVIAPATRCGNSQAWIPSVEHHHGSSESDGHEDESEPDVPADEATRRNLPPSRDTGSSVPAVLTPAQLAETRVKQVSELLEPMKKALNGYTGYTLVTAGNEPFFDRLRNLIGSAHYWAPDMPIIVYDLGFTGGQHEQIKSWRNVEVRVFDYSKYPEHFRDLHTYAFKPTIMLETVKERMKILYACLVTRVLQCRVLTSGTQVSGYKHGDAQVPAGSV